MDLRIVSMLNSKLQTIIQPKKEDVMFKKLSLIGVLCISLIALSGTYANAWFIPSPPGVSGWGCCSEATITVDMGGGGPIDKDTGEVKDQETELLVRIKLIEAYVVMFNPTHLKKESNRLVLYGVGGSVPVKDIERPLAGVFPNDRGFYELDTTVVLDVDQCHGGKYPDCENPLRPLPWPAGLPFTEEEEKAAKFLLYWNIITLDNIVEDYYDIVKGGGWYPTGLRIILASVFAELDGKWAQGGPSEVLVMTDELHNAPEWPDLADPWPDPISPPAPGDPPLINYVIRLDGEPFAFYDHQDAGSTVKVNARHGVLSNDFDVRVVEVDGEVEVLQGDQLEVVAVGPAEGSIYPSLVGHSFSTDNDGTITLNADGSFTYTTPDDLSVTDDFVWYKNGEINGPNESNVTVLHLGIIY
jgi:hypothetical protein